MTEGPSSVVSGLAEDGQRAYHILFLWVAGLGGLHCEVLARGSRTH